MNTFCRPALHRALLALVAAAVLCAQWVGTRHRVEHADRLGALALAHAEIAAHEPAAWHDCTAFDAAALGEGPPAATPPCAVPPSPAAPVASEGSRAGAAPQALGYLSRAPPRA